MQKILMKGKDPIICKTVVCTKFVLNKNLVQIKEIQI